jgi:hypothetical protein
LKTYKKQFAGAKKKPLSDGTNGREISKSRKASIC